MQRYVVLFILMLWSFNGFSQEFLLNGRVVANNSPVMANLSIVGLQKNIKTDSLGYFSFGSLKESEYTLKISAIGYLPQTRSVILKSDTLLHDIELLTNEAQLNDVVITGTQKLVNRLESLVPVEIYSSNFFKKNPSANLFESLQNINGIRPQLNCNICNTGDIHINGLEGPYTMVLIDGMPIVSSLSTVYGLAGIPTALVERIEVVKGPASSLYGSEAVGGLINIITKKAENAASIFADIMATDYAEFNVDLGFKLNIKDKISVLTGINHFKYNHKVDHNLDGFTDVTLQNRISIFQKWNIDRKQNRLFSIAGRFLYEDRWGGDMKWNKSFRGGNTIYGESIYTKRFELIGNYQLPIKEKFMFSFSLTNHQQDSRYGSTSYIAQQRINFSQLTWDKKIGIHDLLMGAALRYTYYDDNTPATFYGLKNAPDHTFLPGVFIQNEMTINKQQTVLAGIRLDHNTKHGVVFTPRLAYKFKINDQNILRLNFGTGFRVVNIFTEDHAALTGARTVQIANKINPERSYNVNLNYLSKFYSSNGAIFSFDIAAFYTHFDNRIIADYDSNPTQIRYDNLKGYAVSKGITLNVDMALPIGLKVTAGATIQDVAFTQNGIKENQILTEKVSATWAISYPLPLNNLSIDYTGNIYGPMRLPLGSALDPRAEFSPTWSIQNVQLVYRGFKNIELYGGVKNLLNFTPNRSNPFIIARSHDPFNKQVQFDPQGKPLVNAENPYGLVFDPSYMYAPNQGIRGFFGLRLTFL